MPYAEIGQYLIGKVDYAGICDGFYSFYSTYSTPCGTIAVTDCSELDNLATIMKEINHRYTFDPSLTSSFQRLDGYYPVIFFDYVNPEKPDVPLNKNDAFQKVQKRRVQEKR